MENFFVYTIIVEKGRAKLNDTIDRFGLRSTETIQASQYLDEILNLGKHRLVEKENSCVCQD